MKKNLLFVMIALQSWAAYSGLLSMPLWIQAVSANIADAAALVGQMASLQLLFAAATGLAYSKIIGKTNCRVMAMCALPVLLLANLASASAETVNLLFATRALSGMAEGILLANLNTIIPRSGNPDRLFAFSQTSIGVFGILFFSTVPNYIGTHGASIVFYAVCAVAVLAFIGAFTIDNGKADDTTAAPATSTTGWPLISILSLCALGLIFAGAQAGWAEMARMGGAKGYSIGEVGRYLVWGQFLCLLAPIVGVWVSTKFGRFHAIVTGVTIYTFVIACASMPLPATWYILSAASFQFGTLFIATSFFGYLATFKDGGKAISSAPAAINIGSAFGPALAGWVVFQAGYAQMGAMLIALFWIGFFLALMIGIKRQNERA